MKERPILFSTEMVKAIIAGNKTQTRRIVKDDALEWLAPDMFTPEFVASTENNLCSYGNAGDILWVRESHFIYYHKNFIAIKYRDGFEQHFYFKELSLNLLKKLSARQSLNKSWVTGRFLPKELARIWIQIESIRIDRLQEINEEDAKAEGVDRWIEERMKSKPIHYKIYSDFDNPTDPAFYSSTAVCSYETLWRKINGKDSWNENPWVWVISFKVLSTTGKPVLQESEVAHG